MRGRHVLAGLVATILVLAAPALADGEAQILAPSGRLRVGVYPGSPTSMVTDAAGQTHGLAHDVGATLAGRLGVPADYVRFARVADIVAAIKAGEIDMTITNATPARANDVDFSRPVLSIELGFLVPAGSAITDLAAIDRPGVRIGVTKGSTSERTLPQRFRAATIVPADSVTAVIAMFAQGAIDLYATNKPTLFELADRMPGARLLDGNWGLEHMAVAIPKGRDAALPFVNQFVTAAQADGSLARMQQQAGLRGAARAPDGP